MSRYRVMGVDKETKADVNVIVDALSPATARGSIESEGVIVTDVVEMVDGPNGGETNSDTSQATSEIEPPSIFADADYIDTVTPPPITEHAKSPLPSNTPEQSLTTLDDPRRVPVPYVSIILNIVLCLLMIILFLLLARDVRLSLSESTIVNAKTITRLMFSFVGVVAVFNSWKLFVPLWSNPRRTAEIMVVLNALVAMLALWVILMRVGTDSFLLGRWDFDHYGLSTFEWVVFLFWFVTPITTSIALIRRGIKSEDPMAIY